MNREVLNNALIAMGYRKMDKGTHYGKPIGFGIVICKIDEANERMTFSSMLKNHKNETLIWDSATTPLVIIDNETEKEIELEDNELFNEYTLKIAYAEYECHSSKIIDYLNGLKETFAFITSMDYMSMIKL